MTNKEKKDWLAAKFPLTVIRDRYNGTYSGAMWLAFPLPYSYIPSGVSASDFACANFWKGYKEPVGKGDYASDAVTDLIRQMNTEEPEESEDERIRKGIILFLSVCANKKHMVVPARFFAYLEKQKPVEDLSKRKVYDIMSKLSNLSQSELIPLDSKEFEIINEITTDVRSLLDYPIEQKPSISCGHENDTAWSEEDEHRRTDAIYFLKSTRKHYADTREIEKSIDWLKSLRPQPKQEWSEKDEKTLASIIDYLDRSDLVNYDEFIEFEEFLQSLPMRCPKKSDNWKPSEMQLEALDNARHSGGSHYLLDSLYNDLKKL